MQSLKKAKILAVDDEKFNLDIITRYLTRADFNVVTASDGEEAIRRLREHPDVEVIVLDRMMPKLNGMDVIRLLKDHKTYKKIPIVMQTAAAQTSQVIEGIQAGVYYYLTKPYNGALLVSIVKSALESGFRLRSMESEFNRSFDVPCLMNNAEFEFQTRDEVRSLVSYLSGIFIDSGSVSIGLMELMMNAVEHGNLGITYDEKKQMLCDNTFESEIQNRLDLPENKEKFASVAINLTGARAEFTISDHGQGFDWKKYMKISPDRVTDPNGRGVAMSVASLADVTYHGNGSMVTFAIDGVIPSPILN